MRLVFASGPIAESRYLPFDRGTNLSVLQRESFTSATLSTRTASGQANARTESRTIVPLLVLLQEPGEPKLACAMRRSDALQTQLVMKYRDHASDFLIRCYNEVEAADRAIEPRLDPCCCRENFLDARMRATDDDRETFWRAHGKRKFVHFQSPGLL